MATKNEPGQFDCYGKAEPDEPMFVLLGRDRFAPSLIDLWTRARLKSNEALNVVQEAADCAAAMRNWLYLSKKREVRVIQFITTEALMAELERRSALEHIAAASLAPSDFAPSAPIALDPPVGQWPDGKRANGSHFETSAIPPDDPESGHDA